MGKKFGFGMLVGAVAGAVAGLFLAPKAGKELRGDVLKLYKRLQAEDPKKIAQEVFGNVSDESQRAVKHIYTELAQEVSRLRQNSSTIDTQKYVGAVRNVVDMVRNDHALPEDALKKLASYLEQDVKKLVTGRTKKTSSSTKKPTAKKSTTKKTSVSSTRAKKSAA